MRGANIFLTNEIGEYTNEELNAIIGTLQRELARRECEKRMKAWKEMVCAIHKYIDEWGSFTISNGIDTIAVDTSLVDNWEVEELSVECD